MPASYFSAVSHLAGEPEVSKASEYIGILMDHRSLFLYIGGVPVPFSSAFKAKSAFVLVGRSRAKIRFPTSRNYIFFIHYETQYYPILMCQAFLLPCSSSRRMLRGFEDNNREQNATTSSITGNNVTPQMYMIATNDGCETLFQCTSYPHAICQVFLPLCSESRRRRGRGV